MPKANHDDLSVKTFASLRFMGRKLDPEQVTGILQAKPTIAYRYGDVYMREGENCAEGRTGLWLISSEKTVHSNDLNDHLAYLVQIIFSEGSNDRLDKLRQVMATGDVEADVGCFWSGPPGASKPVIDRSLKAALKKVAGHFEKDFHTAEEWEPAAEELRA